MEFWSDGWVTSEAVRVAMPAVLSVTLKVLLPLTRAALGGKDALASLEAIAMVSLVFTTFQFESTALTVTLKAVPAVCATGTPVLPLAVAGAAGSPGARSCSFAKGSGPATTFAAVVSLRPGLLNPIVIVS